MLVLEPKKRYKMKQIMAHKWMMADKQTTVHLPMTSAAAQNGGGGNGKTKVFNEQILRLMKDLGIEHHKTIEVCIRATYIIHTCTCTCYMYMCNVRQTSL